MGIVANLRNITAPSLFKTFSEVVIKVTYRAKTSSTYNPTTGQTPTYTEYENVEVIRREYASDEINNTVQPGDIEFKVRVATLAVKPLPTNVFLVGTEVWNIVSVVGAPVDNAVIYKCQCRRKAS